MIRVAVTLVAIALLITQCRKPKWIVGRLILWMMNRGHAGLTTWGLSHLTIGKADALLDVGCGGGRTVQTLASIASEGRVCGVDYSAQSVAAARRTNRDLIAAGRVDIQLASVSKLPFPDGTFDAVTAVETHYYWPDPVNDFREIRRVLEPGGRLLIIAEAYKRRKYDPTALVMKMLGGTCLTVREHEELLAAAGYTDVQIFEERAKGWLCAVAESL